MTVADFVSDLLAALTQFEVSQQVTVEAEGPTVSGRAFLAEEMFLAFYFNQKTGTQAFALVKGSQRLWGIDFDNMRGWHLHPLEAPEQHLTIESQTVSDIIQQFSTVTTKLT